MNAEQLATGNWQPSTKYEIPDTRYEILIIQNKLNFKIGKKKATFFPAKLYPNEQ